MSTTLISPETTPAEHTQETQKKSSTISTPYQLQKRVRVFAVDARAFVEKLPKALASSKDAAQLIRVSGDLGMHCIEAAEAPSKKAFIYNMKLCRKEIKEVLYWLQLFDGSLSGYTEKRRIALYNEAHDLRRIFSAIVKTATTKK